MPESIWLLGREIPVYGLCYFGGIFLAAGVAALICPKRGIRRDDLVGAAVYAVVGGLLGAKLLYIAVSLRQIVEQQIPWTAVLRGGFVFYGGLIGGVLGMLIYCRQFTVPFWDMADVSAVVVPLGHALGRVGCFSAGCCYGIPYDGPLSYTYARLNNTDFTPIGVPLLPIQLIESAVLLLLFAGLLIAFLRRPNAKQLYVAAYVLAYGAIRFTLEFFRGDEARGLFFGLSTSQWISLAAGIAAIVWLIVRRRAVRKSEG